MSSAPKGDWERHCIGLLPLRRPESVRVMLPLQDGIRGKARRRAVWALPGTYVYNLGGFEPSWPPGGPIHEHAGVLLGYGFDWSVVSKYLYRAQLLISRGDQIAPIRVGLDCTRGKDPEAKTRLIAIAAELRLMNEAHSSDGMDQPDFTF